MINPMITHYACLGKKDVMKPEVIGFISLKEGKGEFFDKKTGRYFYLYELGEFVNILNKNGYIIENNKA